MGFHSILGILRKNVLSRTVEIRFLYTVLCRGISTSVFPYTLSSDLDYPK